MHRYKLTVEYDGAPYCGWQSQAGGGGVQDRISEAITAFCGETPTIFAAGRTDTGVHARGQVIHFDLERAKPIDNIRDGLNFHLKPDPIAIIDAQEVNEDFHARFSARKRYYLYRLISRRAPLALDDARAWWVPQTIDPHKMHTAAQLFIGQHDFTTFRSSQCQAASPVKTIDSCAVEIMDDVIHVSVSARSFLHHQVRSMVGALKCVGTGKWDIDHLQAALKAADRTACAPVAPAQGLFFMRVDYAEK